MKTYLTTPIYYVNAAPHIGHAHTTVMADIMKRNRQMIGIDTWLSTGCDEHGQKNQAASEASGQTYQEYLDERSAQFRDAFDRLDVSYDQFVRTSREGHKETVARFIQRLFDQGLLEKKKYAGMYCTGCEQFKKESDLNEDGRCPDHPSLELELIDETNYFFKIDPFRERLIAHIEANPGFVQPDRYRTELLNMLRSPLEDLCISRPKARVKLGVELPFDADFVVYVWFDALINYISNLDWPSERFDTWWPGCSHLIGKDILKTHGVYWPIMLLAIDVDLPQSLLVHGHWLGAGNVKMSKSLGNVVDPFEVIDAMGPDALRYYMARNMRVESDSQISIDLIEGAYNGDLGNKLGNLLSRVVKFVHARYDGKVPARSDVLGAEDQAVREQVLSAVQSFARPLGMPDIPRLATALIEEAARLNEYLTARAPWTLIKDEATAAEAATAIYVTLDCLRLIFEGMLPIIPRSATLALETLGTPFEAGTSAWQIGLDRLPAGAALGEPVILYQRTEGRTAPA